MKINYFLEKLINKNNLSLNESENLAEIILRGELTSTQTASVLTALRMKEEKEEEILGFIKTMRKFMLKIETKGLVIDTCGTGGDGKNTFNVSTASALVVAGTGVKVAKHGNRNASSLCGSADVLESLGVNINLDPKKAGDCLLKTGITFLYAPNFHPSMKFVAPVRKELKMRTIFNYIGPFSNPAGVKRQIIGVPDLKMAEKLANIAKNLDYEKLFIVTSSDGMDEISIFSNTYIYVVTRNKVEKTVIKPQEFGYKYKNLDDGLKGGDAKENAGIISDLLDGTKGPKRDIVLLNSAAALYVAGKVKDLNEGLELARESIDGRFAEKVLKKFIKYGKNN